MELTIREVVFPRKSGPGELTITPFSRQEERSPTRGCFQDFFRHCEGTAQEHNDGVEHVIVNLFLAKQALERIKKAHLESITDAYSRFSLSAPPPIPREVVCGNNDNEGEPWVAESLKTLFCRR
jgi:hypothetical protein